MQIRDDDYWVLYQQKFNRTELERIKIENKRKKYFSWKRKKKN